MLQNVSIITDDMILPSFGTPCAYGQGALAAGIVTAEGGERRSNSCPLGTLQWPYLWTKQFSFHSGVKTTAWAEREKMACLFLSLERKEAEIYNSSFQMFYIWVEEVGGTL